MANRKIGWDRNALRQFNKAILYIAEDSIQNAENVRTDILEIIGTLPSYPEKFPPDKYKIDNDGNFRVFEMHRLRVAYFAGADIIRILRVRHTSREPQAY